MIDNYFRVPINNKLSLAYIPKGKNTKWNYFCSILPQFFIAIRTYQNTIASYLSALFNWNTWNVDPISLWEFNGMNPTFSTSKPITRPITLPSINCLNNIISPKHNNSPTFTYDWRKYAIEDYWMFHDNKHTGIIINTIYQLQINRFKPRLITEFIKLKHPVFSINFHPINDSLNVLDLVDMPTLKEAKELAESYYNIWLKVNHNLLTK